MPLNDRDPYWAARFRMTPQQMDELRRRAEQTVRDSYDAATRSMARAGGSAQRLGEQTGAAVDRFKSGVQQEIDKALRSPQARPAPKAPVPRAPVAPSKRDAARDFGAATVMEQVSTGEGAGGEGGYAMTYAGGKYYPPGWPKLTDLTLDQVSLVQAEIRKRGGQSPVGKYQFMPNALTDLRRDLKLTGQEKFSPEMQDRLMRERMHYRGYDDFLAGRIDATQLQKNFAKEWRSVDYGNGRTFDGQHLGTTTGQIQSVFGSAKAEADHLTDLGLDPFGRAWR